MTRACYIKVVHFLTDAGPYIVKDIRLVHRCGTDGSMRACHAAGPGSIPGRDKFPGWGFFLGFSSPVRWMSRSFRPTRSPSIIWPSLSSIIISLRAPMTWDVDAPRTLKYTSLCERVYIHSQYMKSRKSCSRTRRKFRVKFPGWPVPNPSTIRRQVKRFKETGPSKNKKVNRRRHVLTEETLDEIGERNNWKGSVCFGAAPVCGPVWRPAGQPRTWATAVCSRA